MSWRPSIRERLTKLSYWFFTGQSYISPEEEKAIITEEFYRCEQPMDREERVGSASESLLLQEPKPSLVDLLRWYGVASLRAGESKTLFEALRDRELGMCRMVLEAAAKEVERHLKDITALGLPERTYELPCVAQGIRNLNLETILGQKTTKNTPKT